MSGGLVVVTGAWGFVGNALCERLRRRHRPLVGLVRKVEGGMPPDLQPVGDLATVDDAVLDDVLSGAEAVVHLAGRAHVLDDAHPDPERAYAQANVVATERLARAAVRADVRRFVFASTVKVNGESSPPGRPFRPDDPPAPQDAYGRSKLAAERALFAATEGTATVPVVLRFPLVYGRHARGNFARLVRAVVAGRPLPLGAIRNRRSLIYLGNLLDAIEAALDVPQPRAGVYLVADDDVVSTAQLVRAIAAAWKVPLRMQSVPVPLLKLGGFLLGKSGAVARLTGSLEVDSTAFREMTGWKPRHRFAAALAETAAFHRSRGGVV
jgi:UDP-glucose 4-epimerase